MSSPSLSEALSHVAQERSDALAVVLQDRDVTYRELLDGTARLAGTLKAHGVGRGDRVLIFSESNPEYLMALFACSRLGAVLTTVYASFGVDEIEYIIDHSRAEVALVDPTLRPTFESLLHEGADVTVVDLVDGAAPGSAVEPLWTDETSSGEAAVLICYTSGTTSRPKAVVHANRGLVDAARAHVALWEVTPDDRVLLMTPMAWLYGIVTTSLTALMGGAAIVMRGQFSPVRMLDAIRTQDVTVTMGVGTMYSKLLSVALEDGATSVDSKLRLCLSGGESRNESTLEKFRQTFGVPVHDIYAASECFPIVSYSPSLDPLPKPTSAGRVVPGSQIRIVDDAGQDVAPGEVGELLAHGQAIMLGYFDQEEMTASVLDQDGWFRTKDLARMDDDGYVYIVGRATEMIIRGGANVSPAEVERVFADHPDVDEVAVVGVPDDVYGQSVVAFVVSRSRTVTVEQLQAHAADRLAKYKVPSEVHLVEDLPRGSTGKIQRSAILDLLATDSGADARV